MPLINHQIRLAARPVGIGEVMRAGGVGKVLASNWADCCTEGIKQITQWMQEGKFKSREDIVEGLNTFPETLNMLFEGKSFGKLVLTIINE